MLITIGHGPNYIDSCETSAQFIENRLLPIIGSTPANKTVSQVYKSQSGQHFFFFEIKKIRTLKNVINDFLTMNCSRTRRAKSRNKKIAFIKISHTFIAEKRSAPVRYIAQAHRLFRWLGSSEVLLDTEVRQAIATPISNETVQQLFIKCGIIIYCS